MTRVETNSGYTTATLAYTAKITDYIIAYTGLTAARTVTLQTSNAGLRNKVIIIKDESGNGTLSIWAGTFDGSGATPAVLTAYGAKRLYSNGSAWFSW